MENYQEELKVARETGIGIVIRFQENPNHPLDIKGKCPHCGGTHGVDKHGKWVHNIRVGDNYETPSDIEYMCNNIDYSWTEDCRCANCGEMFSLKNGC